MDIKRNIETKYGYVEVDFHFEDNRWSGIIDKDNCVVILNGDTLEVVEEKLVKAWEMMVIFIKIYENNPDKDKVEKEILKNLFTRDWWKLHKN